MAVHAVADIRNVALVGHGAAGKTSLADALLHKAGAVSRHGSVDEGTSVSDYDEEEHKRKYSIDTAVIHADYKGKHFALARHARQSRFRRRRSAAAQRGRNRRHRHQCQPAASRSTPAACSAKPASAASRGWSSSTSSTATTSISTSSSTPSATLRQELRPASTPRSASAPSSRPSSACSIRRECSRRDARSISPRRRAQARRRHRRKRRGPHGEIPWPRATSSDDELDAALPKAIAAGTVIPIFCTSAKKDIGVAELLDAIATYAPSPHRRKHARRPTGTATSRRSLPSEIRRVRRPGLQDDVRQVRRQPQLSSASSRAS